MAKSKQITPEFFEALLKLLEFQVIEKVIDTTVDEIYFSVSYKITPVKQPQYAVDKLLAVLGNAKLRNSSVTPRAMETNNCAQHTHHSELILEICFDYIPPYVGNVPCKNLDMLHPAVRN